MQFILFPNSSYSFLSIGLLILSFFPKMQTVSCPAFGRVFIIIKIIIEGAYVEKEFKCLPDDQYLYHLVCRIQNTKFLQMIVFFDCLEDIVGILVDLTPAFRADELLFYLAILVILCLLILIQVVNLKVHWSTSSLLVKIHLISIENKFLFYIFF